LEECRSNLALAQKQLSPSSLASCVEQIALAAARAGATEEAMRIWRRKDTIDKTKLDRLDEIANAGMRNALSTYYADLAKSSPSAPYIRNAQKILKSVK
jgi:hypothetical protein